MGNNHLLNIVEKLSCRGQMSSIQRMEAKARRKANRRMKLEREKESMKLFEDFLKSKMESPEFLEEFTASARCK